MTGAPGADCCAAGDGQPCLTGLHVQGGWQPRPQLQASPLCRHRWGARLHVGAGVLPGLGVQEGGGEAGRRLHLGLGHHARQGAHAAHPHVEGRAQVGHPGDAALQANHMAYWWGCPESLKRHKGLAT